MTYFKFDIPKINENISSYNDIKQNCMEDINFVYRGLGYMESAWNDPVAYTFMEKIKKDKYNLNEYFNYLDSLHGEISQFKENIDDICSRYGYRRNTVALKFDDSELETCESYLNDIITLLNDCLNRIYVPSYYKYGCSYSVSILEQEIKKIKTTVNLILSGIKDISKSINNEIEDSKFRLKRISGFEYNLKTTDYIWNTVDLEAKKESIDVTSKMTYSTMESEKIDLEKLNDEFVGAKGISKTYGDNASLSEIKDFKEEHLINKVDSYKPIAQQVIKDNQEEYIDVKLNDHSNPNLKPQSVLNFDAQNDFDVNIISYNNSNNQNFDTKN